MPRRKGESIFSYSLTRPYPFSWFTYVALIVGVVFTVLFSFIALATNGYDLEIKYTLDLDGTLDADYWFQHPPFSWFSQTNVSCEPALLTTGNQYFTSNQGLTYSLDGIQNVSLNFDDEGRTLPALGYMNVTLANCEVTNIHLEFQRRDNTRLGKNWWSWGNTYATVSQSTLAQRMTNTDFEQATANCELDTKSGRISMNLTTTLPQIKAIGQVQDAVLSRNISKHANMWFGSELMYLWYEQLSLALGYTAPSNDQNTFDSGTVNLWRNLDTYDYTDLAFFNFNAIFLDDGGMTASFLNGTDNMANWTQKRLPHISTTVDTFGKALYSLILSDFGVGDETNALSTWDGVQWLQNRRDLDLSAHSDAYWTGCPVDVNHTMIDSAFYPYNRDYCKVVKSLGQHPNLTSTRPPTIFAQYLCSIPRRKDGGSLFFAVLIADLVFLQALWTVLNFAATLWLEQKYTEINHCEGCRSSGPVVAEKNPGPGRTGYKRVSDDDLSACGVDTGQEIELSRLDQRKVRTI